ncbi:hypothetical protein [Sorangium sp. So ce1099]|uniref:hypothetical protein n=1 Tax=Sorangium sp. So ce1099 TaxID=3133331 RepID=UPI003F5F9163
MSLNISCLLLLVACSGSGSGASTGSTSGAGDTGGSGGDPSGSGGSGGNGGAPSGSGGSGGNGGAPSGSGGSGGNGGSGGDPSGSGGSGGNGGSGGDPSGSGGAGYGGAGGAGGAGGGGSGGAGGGGSGGAGSGGAGGGGSGGAGGGAGGGGSGDLEFRSVCGTSGNLLDTPEAFLDLGHLAQVRRLFVSGDRILSWDYDRWILWDTAARAAIADGHAPGGIDYEDPMEPPPELPGGVELRGELMLVQTNPLHAFDLRSAADGSLLATVSAEYDRVGLASDGSYVWTLDNYRDLTIWSPSGDEVLSTTVSRPGALHAAPDAVRIAQQGIGALPIEVVPVDGSPQTLTPTFSGTFHAWSADGERFLTTAGTTVRVYSKAGVQESIVFLPTTAGLSTTGDYLWTYQGNTPGYPLKIYRIGGGDIPVVEYSYSFAVTVVPTERAIAVINEPQSKFEVIDLGGAEITRTEHEIARETNSLAHIDGGLRWAVTTYGSTIAQRGTLADPDATATLGCGPSTLDASASGHVAVATASGATVIYDTAHLDAGPTMSLSLYSPHVELSADGRLLVAHAPRSPDSDLRVISLTDGAELALPDIGGSLIDFTISAGGTTLGRRYYPPAGTSGSGARIVSDVSGETVFFQSTGPGQMPVISPGGQHFLLADKGPGGGCGFTQFYEEGVLVNVVPGCAIGWIDDTRALVQTYRRNASDRWEYEASTVYDPTGNVVSTPPLPPILTRQQGSMSGGIVPVSPTAIHVRGGSTIHDVDTGAVVTTLPVAGLLAADHVVYFCGRGVCATPY